MFDCLKAYWSNEFIFFNKSPQIILSFLNITKLWEEFPCGINLSIMQHFGSYGVIKHKNPSI